MKSLFLRILGLLLCSFVCILVISFLLFRWINSEFEPGDNRFKKVSNKIAIELVEKIDNHDDDDLKRLRRKLSRRYGMQTWLLDLNNRSVVSPPAPEKILSQITGYPMVLTPERNPAGRLYLTAFEVSKDGKNYRVIMQAKHPPFIHNKKFHNFLMPVLAVIIGLLITAALLSAWIIKPLRAFGKTTRLITGENLGARVPQKITDRCDAFGELGRDFNQMTRRVEQSVEGHKQLLRDVSHELRSPLARIQVASSLSAQKYGDQIEFERIEHEVGRLDTLIEELLSLSRLQNETEITPQRINLSSLLATVVENANFEFKPETRSAAFSSKLDIHLFGDAPLLERAFENVVRNALRYTPEGSQIEVIAATNKGFAEVTVRDFGEGVDESLLDRIFEPFFRVDYARGLNNEHHGVGLALTRTIVKLHSGTIAAQNAKGGGLFVTFKLPLAPK